MTVTLFFGLHSCREEACGAQFWQESDACSKCL